MDVMSDQEARALLEDHNHHPRVMLSFPQQHSKQFQLTICSWTELFITWLFFIRHYSDDISALDVMKQNNLTEASFFDRI